MDLKVAGRGRELAHRGANLWGAIGARHFRDTCHRSLVRSWSPVERQWEVGGYVFPKDGWADKHGRMLQMALMGPAGTVCSSGKSAIFQPFQPVWDRQDVHRKQNLHMINRGWERWRETHTLKTGTNTSQGHTPSWLTWCHLICCTGPKSEIWTQNEDESRAQVWQQYFIYLFIWLLALKYIPTLCF